MENTEKEQQAIDAVRAYLDAEKIHYEYDAAKRQVSFTVYGEDFPVTLTLIAEDDRLDTFSQLPFEIRGDGKDVLVAKAIAAVNCRIAYGKFCFYRDKNLVAYENTEYLTGLTGFGLEYGKSVVLPAYSIIEDYNHKLYALNTGKMSIDDFLKKLKS